MATQPGISAVEVKAIADGVRIALRKKLEPVDATLAALAEQLHALAARLAAVEQSRSQPWRFDIERDPASGLMISVTARPTE
jgi:hypothetical protein